jgi:hypothetical protein
VNTVLYLWVPEYVGKFLGSYTTGSSSRRTQLHEISYFSSMFVVALLRAEAWNPPVVRCVPAR